MWLTTTLQLLLLLTTMHQTTGQCEGVWSNGDFPISCLEYLGSSSDNIEVTATTTPASSSLPYILLQDSETLDISTDVSPTSTQLDLLEDTSIPVLFMTATDSDLRTPTPSTVATTSISILELDMSVDMNFELSSELDDTSTLFIEQLVVMTTNTLDQSSSLSTAAVNSSTIEVLVETPSASTVNDPVEPSVTADIGIIPLITSPDSLLATVFSEGLSSPLPSSVESQIMLEPTSVPASPTLLPDISSSTEVEPEESTLPSEVFITAAPQTIFTDIPSGQNITSLTHTPTPPPIIPSPTTSMPADLSETPSPDPFLSTPPLAMDRTETASSTIPSVSAPSTTADIHSSVLLPIAAAPTSPSSLPGPSETMLVSTLALPATTAQQSILQTIIGALGTGGLAGVAAGVGLIIILTCILCCCCCCACCCRSRSKKSLEFADSGYSYENKNATELYPLPNGGVSGTGYRSYSHGSGLDLQSHHHYESAADVNAYRAVEEDDFTYGGEPSQSNLPGSQALAHSQPLHHSQSYHLGHHHPSLSHHHSQASALTDVFQKTTLPELSPMSYSLTATANPVHSDNFYMNTMPASNVSLREPTMFALSLQQEESKSAHGSRLSMNGSKTSIHGSRPSVNGSKASNIHGSRQLVYNSGTSRESLLGLRGGAKEHSVDEEAGLPLPSLLLHHRVSSPSLPPPTSSNENMELPTRDSPRPKLATFTLSSLHNKDFASMTCLTDDHGNAISPTCTTPTSPSPLPNEVEPVQRKLTKRKDLSSLTSLDFMSGPATNKENRGGTIIEEEESSQSSKVNSDKAKDESPAIKKTRSKRLSRLEKLTSLDYIRQSFRLKKKKVSFETSSEETPKTVSRKNSALKNRHHGDTTITNEHAHGHHDNEAMGPERVRGKMEWHQARRNSSTSTDMFSPTENIARNMYIQHHHHAFPDTHAAMAMSYTPQLSQPNYYLPSHMPGGGVPGIPMHPHMYPHPVQLSQQFYPSQLSQGYQYPPPHHIPMGDPYGRGFAREMPPNGGRADPRYHEVITPDYSDITTPEHDSSRRQQRISLDEEYELRDHFNRRPETSRYTEDTSPTNHTPDTDTEEHRYRDGPSGTRPNYVNGRTAGHKEHMDMMTSPQRHAATHRRGRNPDPLGEEPGLGGRYAPAAMDLIPEDMYQNSISVDDPPPPVGPDLYPHGSSPHTSPRRRSDHPENGKRHFSSSTRSMSGSKGRVSWNNTVTSYAPDQDKAPELTRL